MSTSLKKSAEIISQTTKEIILQLNGNESKKILSSIIDEVCFKNNICDKAIRRIFGKSTAKSLINAACQDSLILEPVIRKSNPNSLESNCFDGSNVEYNRFRYYIRSKGLLSNYKNLPNVEKIKYIKSIQETEDYINWHKTKRGDIKSTVKVDEKIPVENITTEWSYEQMLNKSLYPDEILKEIKNSNKHFISNYGRHFKGYEISDIGKTYIGYCLMTTYFNTKYNSRYVVLNINGSRTTYKLNRLVAEYFIDNPKNYTDVLFVNDNREDCRVTNIQWGIQPINIPTWNIETKQKGESALFCTKLNKKLVIEIWNNSDTHEKIAKEYGITRSMVTLIKQGKRWSWLTKQFENNLKHAI